jgi:hypothetical protein
MEDWALALAESVSAEALAFGETIRFRGKETRAIVGSTQQTRALEVAGYLEGENLNVVLPIPQLIDYEKNPQVNEIIEMRDKGFRISVVKGMESNSGFELTCELIPQYVVTTPVAKTEPIYITPTKPIDLFVGILSEAVDNVVAELLTPLAPTIISYDSSPLSPSHIVINKSPTKPFDIFAYVSPKAPDNLDIDISPLAPDQLSRDVSPLEPDQLARNASPIAPDQLARDATPIAPDQLDIDISPLEPDQLATDISPLEPDQLSSVELWTPEKTTTQGWWDASDADTITTSGSEVTEIQDKSGNSKHLTPINADGPTTGTTKQNGYNVLEWDNDVNTKQILENDNFVWDQASNEIYFSILYKLIDDGVTTGEQDFLMSGTESSTRISIRRTTTNGYQLLVTGGNISTAGNFPESNSPVILTAKFNASSSFIRVDGKQEAVGTIGNVAFSTLNLGGNFLEDANPEGFIAEAVFFTDGTQVEKVEGYLAHKWGTEDILDSNHTYKTTAP